MIYFNNKYKDDKIIVLYPTIPQLTPKRPAGHPFPKYLNFKWIKKKNNLVKTQIHTKSRFFSCFHTQYTLYFTAFVN